MSEIILIPWGRTDWADAGRFIGVTDLPLNPAGRTEIAQLAESLALTPPDAFQVGPEEACRETAAIITKRIGLRTKRPNTELHELNLGIWQGLSEEEIHQRFTSAHEQFRDNPEIVCPPEGEPVADAAVRLRHAVEKAMKRKNDHRVAFVVGVMAAAALRCVLEDRSLAKFWEYVDAPEVMHRIAWPRPMPPVTPESLVAGTASPLPLKEEKEKKRLGVEKSVHRHRGT